MAWPAVLLPLLLLLLCLLCRAAPPTSDYAALTFPSPAREAWAVVLTSEEYVAGALVVLASVTATNTTRGCLVLHVPDLVPPACLPAFRRMRCVVQAVDRVHNPSFHAAAAAPAAADSPDDDSGEGAAVKRHVFYEWNFTHLRLWQQVRFSKLVYLDADVLLLRPADSLFDRPELSAAKNYNSHEGLLEPKFNAGVMVLEPSLETFDKLMELLKHPIAVTPTGGNQEFFNYFFKDRVNFLPVEFNCNFLIPEHHPSWIPLNSIVIVHFTRLKPWRVSTEKFRFVKKFRRLMSEFGGGKTISAMVARWKQVATHWETAFNTPLPVVQSPLRIKPSKRRGSWTVGGAIPWLSIGVSAVVLTYMLLGQWKRLRTRPSWASRL
mmetsp:Transcript_23483/g.58771  ORF Transcript_23483/g.58771 Transcript_23483/m.58771 type:complete len:379 (-) Transcript_23483:641-1777(-)